MKKFLNKTVKDYKFRKAGEGHRLDEEKKPHPQQVAPVSGPRSAPSGSSASAGQAAMARLEGGRRGRGGGRERTSEAPSKQRHSSPQVARGSASSTTANGATADDVCVAVGSMIIRLVCPICQRSIPYSEVQDHLSFCLQEEYIKEPLSSSVQMIHTLCTDPNKRKNCIETLCKYLDNIIQHPGEQKYRKIRTGNKTFLEKVSSIAGADLFLEAIGFEQTLLPHQDSEEQFYVLPLPNVNSTPADETETESGCVVGGASSEEAGERLSVYRELLSGAEPLRPSLDRQVSVFRPSPHVNNFDLSDDFYQLSVEETRREQKLKSEAVELNQQLRTKAMRERDEVRAAAKFYRYTLLRIRLPDGLFLQAAFRPLEKLQTVREVVSGALVDGSLTFSLSAFGQPLKNDSDTLAALSLVPSAVLNLSWNGAGPQSGLPYLDPGLLQRIQRL
jgi:UBX domain-containing protein 6